MTVRLPHSLKWYVRDYLHKSTGGNVASFPSKAAKKRFANRLSRVHNAPKVVIERTSERYPILHN